MLYDTHCHPYLAKQKTQDEVLENFFRFGGKYINSIGCDIETSQTSIKLAKKHPGVFATIGIHPTYVLKYRDKFEEALTELETLYQENSEHIVGIGETGLDYYWLESLSKKYNISESEIKQIQKDFFIAQIELAQKLKLPLIIHNREARDDVFKILKNSNFKNFVFHCYSEDLEFAQRLVEFAPDGKLGFGGVVTFKNAQKTQEAAKYIPLKNIIIETDSPYLTPTPQRGKQENEPSYTQYVLDTITELRDENPKEIKKAIFENSYNFFHPKA
ncbi:TatD family hydrolase [Candidatus Gracilibacteria bacterium]|nr:TatD family hydrolase [Candidatus Gracilibacteria bacterium]